jgi:hypothetical protein
VPLGRKVFVAVVLSQLITIALILGWYFYTLRSELGSLTKQRAQEAVLQSIAATRITSSLPKWWWRRASYCFRTTSSGRTSPTAGTLFFWAASPSAAFGGSLCWQLRRRILLRHAQQREGRRRHPHQGNTEWSPRPRGRADVAAARLRHCQK